MDAVVKRVIETEIIPHLSPRIKDLLLSVNHKSYNRLEEIRLRCGQPIILRIGNQDYTLDARGQVFRDIDKGYQVDNEDIYRTIASISDNSLYAFEDEIKRGFITISGGHRIGLAGQVIVQNYDIKIMKDFSSVCIRVAREIKDCSASLIPALCPSPSASILNTLIVSPPRCGKTTILRDLARLIARGNRYVNARNVVIVDERSEIGGCYRGVPQLDVGPRTDVLDSCPKALGMLMAIRSLSPQVIITDEIGSKNDIEAIQECVNAGVSIISSIHARNLDELKKRPFVNNLLTMGAFSIVVVLSRRNGPGSIEEIIRWD
ncbi:MAG: stage III sporulation protein AA [Syntrophomonadaceae bacterium]|nr:stage III sporulation protein AA [Syntrophomonadaceae bacterium]